VRRNDEITPDDVERLAPERIVILAGAGRLRTRVSRGSDPALRPTVPLLGVCLGHQAIGVAFGAARRARAEGDARQDLDHRARRPWRVSRHRGPFEVGRYHSLVVSDEGLPEELEVAARVVEERTIMALRHRRYPIHGVQFHPESVLTGEGRHVLRSFLEI